MRASSQGSARTRTGHATGDGVEFLKKMLGSIPCTHSSDGVVSDRIEVNSALVSGTCGRMIEELKPDLSDELMQ